MENHPVSNRQLTFADHHRAAKWQVSEIHRLQNEGIDCSQIDRLDLRRQAYIAVCPNDTEPIVEVDAVEEKVDGQK